MSNQAAWIPEAKTRLQDREVSMPNAGKAAKGKTTSTFVVQEKNPSLPTPPRHAPPHPLYSRKHPLQREGPASAVPLHPLVQKPHMDVRPHLERRQLRRRNAIAPGVKVVAVSSTKNIEKVKALGPHPVAEGVGGLSGGDGETDGGVEFLKDCCETLGGWFKGVGKVRWFCMLIR
ncbi:hypothetical protein P171DRAFT_470376 [Karstenula rhodostoma CBS 690.94]|uniref:Uncharacterized protein n=1 Tax=Karstenula rhodostoma CBS 690.94 TaxID=1392251 RepID=A0A9P4PSX8_9PLEO|nr:hypothetical protein P171DRAFT_470376 [Karstenula rhodostoma CBS 690.94]